MESTYVKNLIMTVIADSESDVWQDAVTEWEIYDCEEDESCSEECICGKENIRHLYSIRNVINGNTLFPIGSSCMERLNFLIKSRHQSAKILKIRMWLKYMGNLLCKSKKGVLIFYVESSLSVR